MIEKGEIWSVARIFVTLHFLFERGDLQPDFFVFFIKTFSK